MKRFIGMMAVFALVLTLFSSCSSGGSSSGGYDAICGLIDYEDFLKLTGCDWANDPDKQNYEIISVGIHRDIEDGEIDVDSTISGIIKDGTTCAELSIENGTFTIAVDVSWSEVQKLVKAKGTRSNVDSDFKEILDEIGSFFWYLRLADTDEQVAWVCVEQSIYDILSDYL